VYERTAALLRARGIRPSAQRVAIAEFALETCAHPCAEQVWERVLERLPVVSRATVYNTLNLLVEKGLLTQIQLPDGRFAYDPKLEPHHHFIDEDSGAVLDIPWSALDVQRLDQLAGFDVRSYQVVLRGRRQKPASS